MEDLASAFIKEGSIKYNPSLLEQRIFVYPWESARDDLYKTFNLRLSEEYALKLDYVAMRLKLSKHSICMNVVKKEIDKLLEDVFKSVAT